MANRDSDEPLLHRLVESTWTVDTLKEWVQEKFNAQEKAVAIALTAQEKAVNAAMAAAEKAVNAALAAQEKAVTKAEQAQIEYNVRSNEFRQVLDDQNKTMLPRIEADQRFKALREIIDKTAEQTNLLLRGESRGAGGIAAQLEAKHTARWVIGLGIGVGMSFLGMVITLIYFLAQR